MQQTLRNGEVLCRVVNKLAPGSVRRVNVGTAVAFKQTVRRGARQCTMECLVPAAHREDRVAPRPSRMGGRAQENISNYLAACAALGMKQDALFTTLDLYENKDYAAVLNNLFHLSQLPPQQPPPKVGQSLQLSRSAAASLSGADERAPPEREIGR